MAGDSGKASPEAPQVAGRVCGRRAVMKSVALQVLAVLLSMVAAFISFNLHGHRWITAERDIRHVDPYAEALPGAYQPQLGKLGGVP